MRHRAVLLVALALALSCGPRATDDRGDRAPEVPSTGLPPRPDALLIRFENVHGEGMARESWEIEVLQMGADVHLRGSLRTAGVSVPVFRPLSPVEYDAFWEWVSGFPLADLRVQEGAVEFVAPWRKTFEIDVVLPDQRIRSRNRWTRPLDGVDWVTEVESHLHQMLLDCVDEELSRQREAPAGSTQVPGTPPDEVPESPREAMVRELRSP